MLTWLARIANVVFILWLANIILREGLPKDEGWLVLTIFLATPIINLLALKQIRTDHIWPFIYFKRLAVEERLRLEELEEQKRRQSSTEARRIR